MDLVYSIDSSDDLIKKNKIDSIINSYDLNTSEVINLDLEETSIITLLEEINMIPFLYDKKIVVAKNLNFLKNQKTDPKLVNLFFDYLKKPVDSTILILVLDSGIKAATIKKIKENSAYFKLDKIDIKDINQIVLDNFNNLGYTISKNALDELILRSNNDYNRVLIEIEKITTYKGNDYNIDINDIFLLVSKDLSDDVYDLLNAIFESNKVVALQIYDSLIKSNVDELKILSVLQNKFIEIYQTKELVLEKVSREQIADIFKVKSGRAYYMIKNANLYKVQQIKDNMNKLLDLEYKIKSGQVDKKLGLQLYLLSV